MPAPRPVDTATFAEALSPGLTLVDFTAAGCGPCRALAPVLDRLAAEQPELTILTVDADAAPDLVRRFDVMAFPTLVVLSAGEPVRRLVGARGLAQLREELHAVAASCAT